MGGGEKERNMDSRAEEQAASKDEETSGRSVQEKTWGWKGKSNLTFKPIVWGKRVSIKQIIFRI